MTDDHCFPHIFQTINLSISLHYFPSDDRHKKKGECKHNTQHFHIASYNRNMCNQHSVSQEVIERTEIGAQAWCLSCVVSLEQLQSWSENAKGLGSDRESQFSVKMKVFPKELPSWASSWSSCYSLGL